MRAGDDVVEDEAAFDRRRRPQPPMTESPLTRTILSSGLSTHQCAPGLNCLRPLSRFYLMRAGSARPFLSDRMTTPVMGYSA
jgi:hypothetical protein